jgi:broad specificity phosphatase PhoE
MQLIYIVRHGETDANLANMVNDKNIIIPLNKTGIKQAKKTGEYFNKIRKLNSNNCCIYTSPSIRAVETATIIANKIKFNKTIIKDDRIIEVDYGKKSGAILGDPIATKSIKLYNEFIKSVKNDPIDMQLKYPEFDTKMQKIFHMESKDAIKKRILTFMKMIFAKKTKHIIIVTHRAIIFNIKNVLFNLMQPGNGDLSNGKNCSIMCIKNENKQIELLTLSNTLHLG